VRPFLSLPARFAAWLGLLALGLAAVQAAPAVTPWTPLFKGIDYLAGTNSVSSGDFNSLMVAHILRINLADPDIRLLTTPRITNYQANVRETAGRTVSEFVQAYGVQVAVNGNFFSPPDYYLPEGTPMDLFGLAISGGIQVSPASAAETACIYFDAQNVGRILPDNWPAASTAGVLNAVAGDYPILVGGRNIGRQYLSQGGSIHDQQPRTAYGLSQDGRTLFLLCIDGRQDFSVGAYDYETAAWMLLAGAHDAVNMDGGGSSTMVTRDSVGQPLRLNYSSAVADSGRERTVGSHFGVFARPVPGFVNDVRVAVQDTTATITWTTTAPATSQVEFGAAIPPDQGTPADPASRTNHSVTLTGLTPGAGYYFRAVSTVDGTRHESSVMHFSTTRTVTSTEVVPMAGRWRYTHANLDGTAWTTPGYNDSGWSGPGAGLLWVNVSGAGSTLDPELLGEPLLADPVTGFPYTTYSFRTHFNASTAPAGSTLAISAYIDDGAVFHLNGHELHRVRMPAAPLAIQHATFATAKPCSSGNADCLDEFIVNVGTFLLPGDNVLAVDVHNQGARSTDITFGARVLLEEPVLPPPNLSISRAGAVPTLTWPGTMFTLQRADSPSGPWTNVPGPVTAGPFAVTDSAVERYFRLTR